MAETERTGWHRKVEKWLREQGISFTSECEDYPPYKLDLYLPDVHAAIEMDGPSHLRRRDRERDDILATKYGVMTLHLVTIGGLIKEETVKAIERFMEFVGPTTYDRKTRKRNRWFVERR